MGNAKGWIDTDRNAVMQDITRLGVDAAAEYQMELIAERTHEGDNRWNDVTIEEMRRALSELAADGRNE